MKKILSFVFIVATASACNSGNSGAYTVPPANTVIATDSVPIIEDELNKQYFGVSVIATAHSKDGSYDVESHWGYNSAVNTIKLPKGGELLQPVLRRGTEPYSFIVGFKMEDDTSFHDYYSITGQNGQMMMRYLKSYSLQ